MEIDDYNSEYFFDKEYLFDEYDKILDEDTDDVRLMLDHAVEVINSVTTKGSIAIAAESAINAINNFLKIYEGGL